MTDERLIKIFIEKSLTDGLEIIGTVEEVISAMREAIEIGINEYVATQKGHVFDIWAIEQRKKHLESMRLDSIGFAEWAYRNDWAGVGIFDDETHWQQYAPTITTDALYDKYLEYLKTKH